MIEEVFESVLHDLDSQGRVDAPDSWDEKIADRLEALRAAYDRLTSPGRSEIDFSDLATQAAYLFAYGIGRAEFTYQLLKRHRGNLGEPIFPNKVARITSLGGGPGSEIAGIVKYLLDPNSGEDVTSIKYWVFDKDGLWSDVCLSLIDNLEEFIPVELVYDRLDLCDQKECGKISLEGDDLLVLSFVISELCSIKKKSDAENSIRGLFKTLDNGSRIFYNDSSASSFYYFFNDARKFVKGLGKISQKSEIVDKITADLDFGPTYVEYMEEFDVTPHLTSDALSKFLVRSM